MKSVEYQRGYDAGYKAAAVDIAIGRGPSLDARRHRMGGLNVPKPSGLHEAVEEHLLSIGSLNQP